MSLSLHVTGVNEAIEDLQNLPQDIRDNVSAEMENALGYAASYAQSIAPVRTGYYRDEIGYEKVGDFEFFLYAGAPYSGVVEYGSMPHIILPRNVSVLRFEVEGEVVFAKYVMHPGTQPQFILTQAMDATESMIEAAIESGIDKAIDP